MPSGSRLVETEATVNAPPTLPAAAQAEDEGSASALETDDESIGVLLGGVTENLPSTSLYAFSREWFRAFKSVLTCLTRACTVRFIEQCILAGAHSGSCRGPGRHGVLQFRCFCLTFVAFGCTLMLRNPVGVIRHDMARDLNVPVPHLGWIDTAMLLPASVYLPCHGGPHIAKSSAHQCLPLLGSLQILLAGRQFSGWGPRELIALSLGLAAGSLLLFAVVSRSYLTVLLVLFMSGSSQALIFPQSVNALSLWYTDIQVLTPTNSLLGLLRGTD